MRARHIFYLLLLSDPGAGGTASAEPDMSCIAPRPASYVPDCGYNGRAYTNSREADNPEYTQLPLDSVNIQLPCIE
ncbi:hypothetical protein EU556_21655 [Hymenobacter fodinae]|uniref:Uncharacterized protein n=1 Tax=Hymenobacter fodinae TaxID=2510796 RepID=A0A4Z0P205_9BACT|nr:hypothetical protein EU556_21655 [Hymenobacter fodinae]